jgi:hypothetical protein
MARGARVPRLPRFDGMARPLFLARLAEAQPIGSAFREMVRSGALPREFLASDQAAPAPVVNRELQATLREVVCDDPEEWPYWPSYGDEIYVVTTGAVFDATGKLAFRTAVSDVAEGITSGDTVPILPTTVTELLKDEVLNGPDAPDQVPLYAAVSVTLFEHEYADMEKVEAAVSGAVSVAKLIAAAASGNVVGIVVALKDILVALAILLDNEDALGNISFVFEDVLTGPNQNRSFIEKIAGSNNLNHYSYEVAIDFKTRDVPGGTPELSISGPDTVNTRREFGTGRYRLQCPNATLRNIQWSATPASERISAPHERATRIEFLASPRGRVYTVSVSAVIDQTGQTLSDSMRVVCTLDTSGVGGGPDTHIP